MKTGRATGLQIAFLMFALMLVAVPLTSFIVKAGNLGGVPLAFAEKGMHFILACLAIAAFPGLRRFALDALSRPIAPSMRIEVAVVALGKLCIAFAIPAGLVLWTWCTQEAGAVDRVVVDPEREFERAFSDAGLVRFGFTVLVAPIVEELVFRGFIYRAFEREWGWLRGMLATSVLFGLYHPYFWSTFASSIVFTCLLRRTGTLWAPILAHTTFNLMAWWPLLGQHVFPHAPARDPSAWTFHLACLAFVLIALPVYVWMSRDRHVVAPTVFLEPNAALPK